MGLVVGVPPAVLELVQQGLLERAFHDGLFPNLAYRMEATFEEWPANSGTEVFMSRPGLLTPVTEPIAPGVDPIPQNVPYEQWSAVLERYASTVDTHIPTSVVSNTNLFLRNINQLGLQAGQSVNRIARNAMFKAYLSGQTLTTLAALAADTTIKVASLNGFLDVIVVGTNVRPVAVSPAAPLPVSITGVAGTRNVIGAIPDNPADPFGPGTLILSAALGAGIAARTPVLSANRPQVIRSGGGTSVDAIGPADTFVLQDAINAAAILRNANVMPHDDGFYHAHISPMANAQVFTDPAFQRLNTSLPEYSIYRNGFIGTLGGVMFFQNNEAPSPINSGARTATGVNAFYSKEIGAETTNETGVNIGRILVTGKGIMYERGLDEKQYVTEAGVTGKVGEFDIVNNGVEVKTERVSLILRAPINRLQDQVAGSWSISTSFPVPSDITAPSGPERYKRGIVIEHALSLLGSAPTITRVIVKNLGCYSERAPKGPFSFSGGTIMARNKSPKSIQGGATGAPPEELPQAVSRVSPVPVPTPPVPAEVFTSKEIRKKRLYRVVTGGYVMVNGLKTGLRTGKVVDDINYDIAKLELQGIKLEDITPPEPNEPEKEEAADSPAPTEELGG